ncbi:hypothetical protein [Clostridium algidicarnis]|uniref:hypothetical protein n=1 Tax=Clostridium algidicarnis TaxID=37659 RepID=UPI0016244247|nr:hypothetical protein [Clostridium algidicarnis]MBB6698252.1 hypothetical protein [Clostridium algidicarnis]
MEKDKRMSIVVVSCDIYKDVVELYLKYLHLNWIDCPFEIFVATETYKPVDETAKPIICGADSTWTQRAIKAIEASQSPYVLLSVDDLFISEKVETEEFTNILNYIKKYDIKYYRIPIFINKNQIFAEHPNNKNVQMIFDNQPYSVSIGTAIWEKNEILKILGDGTKSAWDLENNFSVVDYTKSPKIMEGYVSDKRLLLHSVHMIKKGQWIPKGIKLMRKKGYLIEYRKRGLIPIKERIRPVVYDIGSRICPTRFRAGVKKVFSKVGFKFATKN